MDNDVVDRQAVAMEFDDGTTATHNMVGGTARPSRSIHLVGTIGEIQGAFEDQSFVVRQIDPGTEYSEERVDTDVSGDMQGAFGGHGGGDMRLVEDFVSLVQGEPRSISCTSLDDSISQPPGRIRRRRRDGGSQGRRAGRLLVGSDGWGRPWWFPRRETSSNGYFHEEPALVEMGLESMGRVPASESDTSLTTYGARISLALADSCTSHGGT